MKANEIFTKISEKYKSRKIFHVNDAHRIYRKYYGGTLAYNDFVKVISTTTQYMLELIVDGLIIKLSHSLGYIQLIKHQVKKPFIDWGETNKLKKLLIEENEQLYDKTTGKGKPYIIYHTNKERFSFKWIRRNVKNINYYEFVLSNPIRKYIVKKAKENVTFISKLVDYKQTH